MCGRFTLYRQLDELFERFYIDRAIFFDQVQPRYNIAPSQQVLAVVHDGQQNRIGYLRWGLIPSWAKDPSIGHKLINARAETLTEKPSFKYAFQAKRCIVLADGFYEWKKEDQGKVPMYIHLTRHQPFAFAGLWERWTSPQGEEITSCTIITTEPNEIMAPIHNRMPVILKPGMEEAWLNRQQTDVQVLQKLLKPYPAEELVAYAVTQKVNSPKNDGPELVRAADSV